MSIPFNGIADNNKLYTPWGVIETKIVIYKFLSDQILFHYLIWRNTFISFRNKTYTFRYDAVHFEIFRFANTFPYINLYRFDFKVKTLIKRYGIKQTQNDWTTKKLGLWW